MPLGPVRYVLGGLFIALLAVALIQTARVEGFKVWPIDIPGLKAQLADERQGRIDDRKSYEAAQREANAKNEAQVRKIEARQKEITDNAQNSYNRDLAELRRLRSQAKAPGSKAGGPGVSVVPETTGGADGDGVPRPSCDLLCAQEIELRLLHLQRWIREQTEAGQ